MSRHGPDVVGCAQPSERSARRSAQPIPSCIGKRCNAAMRFDGQRRPTDDQ
ncbi:hypothetical protein [Verminephrobacter eiseniae]|uniref:hypothetical protein n=1 Tax=Verminephrobacter eiseniae TaxID=364317 RepID=UPI0022389216|nr:hypothetical protein [Verminephrobacter eiseniae]